jgi:hypothetical protein
LRVPGKIVSLTHRPTYPQEIFLVLLRVDHSAARRTMSMKNSNDNRNLPDCGAMGHRIICVRMCSTSPVTGTSEKIFSFRNNNHVVKCYAPAALPPGKRNYNHLEEGGWAPQPTWMGVKKSRPHRETIPGPSSS